jgi:hypothetical protein
MTANPAHTFTCSLIGDITFICAVLRIACDGKIAADREIILGTEILRCGLIRRSWYKVARGATAAVSALYVTKKGCSSTRVFFLVCGNDVIIW